MNDEKWLRSHGFQEESPGSWSREEKVDLPGHDEISLMIQVWCGENGRWSSGLIVTLVDGNVKKMVVVETNGESFQASESAMIFALDELRKIFKDEFGLMRSVLEES